MSRLDELRKAGAPKFNNFIIRVDGQPKTGKTRLAWSVSKQHPAPSKLDPKKPVDITDTLAIQFERNSTLSLQEAGINATRVLDLSDPTITLAEMTDIRRELPKLAIEWREQGVENLIVDTLSTLNRFLLRTIIEEPSHNTDMERIRAYGDVDRWHLDFFDALARTKMNIVALVHLQQFAPFGEQGGGTPAAEKMKQAAAVQVDKVTANMVGGIRTDFVPDMRPKPAGHWGRLSDAIIVAKPERITVRAGVKEMRYQFITETTDDFSAGGRLKLPAIVQDNWLYPILSKSYKL
jgi:hypothetical protein